MKAHPNPRRKWTQCEICGQMAYGLHRCPKKIVAELDAQLDMVIDEELSTWDEDVKKFWNSNDTKFYQWLAQEDRY